jgi:hypothetical protein
MGNWKNRDRKVGKRKAFSFKPHKKNSPSPKCSVWELEVWESRTSYQSTLVRCIKCNRILSRVR